MSIRSTPLRASTAMRRGRLTLRVGLSCMAVAIFAAGPASAQSALEKMAARGSELAIKLCATCHLVPGAASGGQAAAPTFRTVANIPDQTGTRIRNALITPSHQMPDLSLTNDEIVALIAYLDTLRTDRTKPLLTSPDDSGKAPPPAKS